MEKHNPQNLIPHPPSDRKGWPWTEANHSLPEKMPDGRQWPQIDIVTPSYNQGPYVEETIRSVLLQGYPNLNYYVIDGGSTDNSIEIIRKYEPWLTYWVSESDSGQSDAINKGFRLGRGDILGWLNSDDIYEPGTLGFVAEAFVRDPNCQLLYGNGWTMDESGNKNLPCKWIKPFNRDSYLRRNYILQPAAFWCRMLWEQVGELDVNLHWTMDWDWLLRATAMTTPRYFEVDFARWRVLPSIKTISGGHSRRAEIAEVSRRYGSFWQLTNLVYFLDRLAWWSERRFGKGLVGRVAYWMSRPVAWLLKGKLWHGQYQD